MFFFRWDSKVPLKVRPLLHWCMSASPRTFHSALNTPVLALHWLSSVRWAEDAQNPLLRQENAQTLSSVCCRQLIYQLHSWRHRSESKQPPIRRTSVFFSWHLAFEQRGLKPVGWGLERAQRKNTPESWRRSWRRMPTLMQGLSSCCC